MPNILKDQLKANGKAILSSYLQAMDLLWSSGVIAVLRDNGRVPSADPAGVNYEAHQAALANWSMGYNVALDCLLNFREIFLDDAPQKENVPVDFGGLEAALEAGDLTEGEINAIRSGASNPTLKPDPESGSAKRAAELKLQLAKRSTTTK